MSDVLGYTQDKSSLKVTTPAGANKLILHELEGEEQVSGLFHFRLVMSAEEAVTPKKLMGEAAHVTLTNGAGDKRIIHGIVSRLSVTGGRVVAELRPKLWLLTLASDCRIFQDKSAVEIIKAVLSDAGVTDVKDSLTGTYAAREYCVQYNETHFDFICRLMEDEGIFYFFTHAEGAHTLVLADDSSAHVAPAGAASVIYREEKARSYYDGEAVTACTLEHVVVPGKYQTDDYNFETPSTELKAKVSGKVGTTQVYDYPGGYVKKDAGDARAKKRIEMLEADALLLSGDSVCRAFAAGTKVTIKEHALADVNAAWVLRRVSHFAASGQYRNAFTAFPADTPFRAPLATKRPRIAGAQTAIVTGKSGEETFTDKFGRIKVMFHWDQLGAGDEKTSCWIRVAQGWAGKNWGAFFLPRVGQEVVVSFLDGDPDRPLVTGSVYNGTQQVPYALPDNATRSTIKSDSSKGGGGFNELRFEDKKDSEEVFLQAQKDLTINVINNETRTVKKDRAATLTEGNDSLTITKGNRTDTISEGNREVKIDKGNDTLTIAKGDRTVTVSTGKETHDVKGTRGLTVTGDETHTCKAKFTHKVTGDFTLKVDGNITIEAGGSITLKSGTGVTVKAGTALSLAGGTTMELKGSASGTVDGGGMLTVKGGMVKIN